MSKVIHEEYLRAYLDGKSVDIMWEYNPNWMLFNADELALDVFNNSNYFFRYTPKVVEVNLDDFYAEYDSCTSTNHKDIFLEDLIEKYLPRGGNK